MEFRIVNKTEYGTDSMRNSKIGVFEGFEIWIYPREGVSVPHFHLVPSSNKRKKNRETCIHLFEPKYFKHGTKGGSLNTNMYPELDAFLRKDVSNNMRNWDLLKKQWFETYPQTKSKYSEDIKQPDYSRITEGVNKTDLVNMKVIDVIEKSPAQRFFIIISEVVGSLYSGKEPQKSILLTPSYNGETTLKTNVDRIYYYLDTKKNIVDDIWVSGNVNNIDDVVNDVVKNRYKNYKFCEVWRTKS